MRILFIALLCSMMAITPAQACKMTKPGALGAGIKASIDDLHKHAGNDFELKNITFPSPGIIAIAYLDKPGGMCWKMTYRISIASTCEATATALENFSC